MQFGVLALGDLSLDPLTGIRLGAASRLAQIVESAVLAERAGFDVFAVGEHHVGPYVISSPPVVLSAALGRTERIGLSTGTTLLGLLDPVRVAEDYGTLGLLTDRGVDLMVGTGISEASYRLFGLDPAEASTLLERHLRELLELWRDGDSRLCPPAVNPIPDVWHATTRNPETALRAARFRGPLFVDNVRVPVSVTEEIVAIYRRSWDERGLPESEARVGAGCALHVAATRQQALARVRPYLSAALAARSGPSSMARPGSDRELQRWLTRANIVVGDPDDVIAAVVHFHERYGHTRQLFACDIGGMPAEVVAEQMGLLGEEVLPRLRALLAPHPPGHSHRGSADPSLLGTVLGVRRDRHELDDGARLGST